MHVHEKYILPIIGPLNRYLIQLFFIRISVTVEDDGYVSRFGILRWVYPFTGWSRPYKWLKRIKKDK